LDYLSYAGNFHNIEPRLIDLLEFFGFIWHALCYLSTTTIEDIFKVHPSFLAGEPLF